MHQGEKMQVTTSARAEPVAEPLISRGGVAARVRDFAEREALGIVVAGLTLAVLALSFRYETHQDGWLTLVAGREIWQHGLPAENTLTVWAHGAMWTDQQWFAQLAYYGLYAAGGLRLVLLVNALLIAGAIAGGIAVARLLGASPQRAAAVAALCLPLTAFQWQLRSQSLVYPLFVLLLWLLVADARAPSWRVVLALPLLALWANLHGSVVLAAALVALGGALGVVRWLRARRVQGRARELSLLRSLVLLLAPGLCLFVSPYWFDLADYYRRTLFNSALSTYVSEWRPTELDLRSTPFFVVAAASLWLLGRSRGLTALERLALVGTAAWGLKSIRGIPWFGFTAMTLLPRATDEAWPSGAAAARARRLHLPLAAAATAAAVAGVAVAAARPLDWLRADWPEPAAAAVARAAERDPSLQIYASARYADWLLWERPELAGRLAIDSRLELLPRSQLRGFFDLANRTGNWRVLAAPFGVLVVDRKDERSLDESLSASGRFRRLYADDSIDVLLRSR
jgi:hypothetical protein